MFPKRGGNKSLDLRYIHILSGSEKINQHASGRMAGNPSGNCYLGMQAETVDRMQLKVCVLFWGLSV